MNMLLVIFYQIWLFEVKFAYTHRKTEIDYNRSEVDNNFFAFCKCGIPMY